MQDESRLDGFYSELRFHWLSSDSLTSGKTSGQHELHRHVWFPTHVVGAADNTTLKVTMANCDVTLHDARSLTSIACDRYVLRYATRETTRVLFPAKSSLSGHILKLSQYAVAQLVPIPVASGLVAARLLGLRVRIPSGAWMCVLCVVHQKTKGKMQDNQDAKQVRIQLVEALCRKVAGSIPDGVVWDFSLT